MRPKGGGNATVTLAACPGCGGKTSCSARALALAIGADCFGGAQTAVRYNSPTWGGFRFETSWGKQNLTSGRKTFFIFPLFSPEFNFWDFAAFYTADWNIIDPNGLFCFHLAGERGSTLVPPLFRGPATTLWRLHGSGTRTRLRDSKLHQIGASILHKPSGLGIYGLWQHEETSGSTNNFVGLNDASFITNLDGTLIRLLAPRCSSKSTTRRPTSGT